MFLINIFHVLFSNPLNFVVLFCCFFIINDISKFINYNSLYNGTTLFTVVVVAAIAMIIFFIVIVTSLSLSSFSISSSSFLHSYLQNLDLSTPFLLSYFFFYHLLSLSQSPLNIL